MDATTFDTIDAGRAQAYRLLATLLAAPPPAALLERLGRLRDDGSAFGARLRPLADAAGATTAREVEREFNRLFIGLERGELVPYASFYRTGFLHGRPLVAVRRDMARLGIARRSGVGEPEDHVAALLEMMAGLIEGRFAGAEAARQRGFFAEHLAGWLPRFFTDLEGAEAARFYRPVAALGHFVVEAEAAGFALAD